MPDRSMIMISYDPESEVALTETDERSLRRALETPDVQVGLRSAQLPIAGEYVRPGGSQVPDPLTLALVVVGTLVAKTLVQEAVKDLYKFFKDYFSRIRSRKQKGYPVRYGVLVDFRSEQKRFYAAMSFKDEETMIIALFRLHLYMADENKGVTNLLDVQKPVEIVYPSSFNPGAAIYLATLSIPIGFGLKWLQGRIPVLNAYGDTGFVVVLFILLCALWGPCWVLPWYKERRYRMAFRDRARAWIKRIDN